jgi:two-component system clock-associated histidine kinase SasA
VSLTADSKNQDVTSQLPSDLPEVWIDVDMIRRVLINLLENAVKYTPMGGRVEVCASAEDDFLLLSIQDNGLGISEVDRERIFDKFTRLKNKTGASGLGVGLAFCKLAVQGHGGKIWVEPAPNRGSKFLFTLPIAKNE